MTREEARKKAEIMMAYADGKDIEFKIKGKDRWETWHKESYTLEFHFDKLDYRIKTEKKEKEYPKTYEECCYILGFENTELVFENDYRDINPPKEQWKRLGLINQFNKLLICRDAYWKLYGEEMGLGKPWEPDYKNPDIDFYVIINIYNRAEKAKYGYGFQQCIFTFPSEEMRDAFYENFKELIEICKKLL